MNTLTNADMFKVDNVEIFRVYLIKNLNSPKDSKSLEKF